MDETGGVPEERTRDSVALMWGFAALGLGLLCIALWVAGLIALYGGHDTDENALAATIALLVVVILAAASTIPSRSSGMVVALIGAATYAGVWVYLRIGFDRMMPDAMLAVLTAVFFVSPLITGLTVSVVGIRRLRAA